MSRWLVALFLLAPLAAAASTAESLSDRVTVDGRVDEYEDDEWLVDGASSPAEKRDDSRLGEDDDIWRVAVTWDAGTVYLALEGRVTAAAFMLLLESGGGGVSDLRAAGAFSREVIAPGFAPNLLALAAPGSPAKVGLAAGSSLSLLDDDEGRARLQTDATGYGALEVAIPWERLGGVDAVVRLLALVADAVGAADAAPDPTAAIGRAAGVTVVLDRMLALLVDDDGDGVPDFGVSPRDRSSVSSGRDAAARAETRLDMSLDRGVFAPDRDEVVAFTIVLESAEPADLFVGARVFSMSGRQIAVLYDDVARTYSGTAISFPEDTWDGRDDGGNLVPGGVYVIVFSWGQNRGARDGAARRAVAVVR